MGTTAEKLSYLNGTKRLLRRRLNSLGANITLDTTFRDYLVWLDRFYNAASSSVKFEILGETTQKATNTSINLIPIYDGQIVTDGITVVLSEGGKISVNGTATRDVWIKITNGIEAIYEDPMTVEDGQYKDTYGWLKEKIKEFNSNTTLYIQDCWGTGTAPSGGYPTMVVVTKRTSGYDFRTNPIENLVINTASRHDKDIYATSTKDNTLEINCVYLYFPQGSVVNQYFWVQACLTSQTKWQPNYDALPPSPDNHKRIINKQGAIIYKASDGTEFPVKLGGIGIYWIELAEIGDYKDRIYYKNGKFYLEKNIGMVYLDGDESGWSQASGPSVNTYQIVNKINAQRTDSTNPYLSNYFKAISVNQRYVDKTMFINVDSTIIFSYNDITTINDFKTWLASDGVEVYYVLAEPVVTEITPLYYETLYEQLQAIVDYETKLKIQEKIGG